MKDHNARVLRWYVSLLPFRFTIHHRAGKRHVNADYMSRVFEDSTEDQEARGGVCPGREVPDLAFSPTPPLSRGMGEGKALQPCTPSYLEATPPAIPAPPSRQPPPTCREAVPAAPPPTLVPRAEGMPATPAKRQTPPCPRELQACCSQLYLQPCHQQESSRARPRVRAPGPDPASGNIWDVRARPRGKVLYTIPAEGRHLEREGGGIFMPSGEGSEQGYLGGGRI